VTFFPRQCIQESLANAKVSARQPWYIGRNSLSRPSTYERRAISTYYIHHWKVLSVHNNSLADSAGLSLLV